VEAVTFVDDLDRIEVRLRLTPEMRPWLREDTRFWIERPRIAPGQLSSLQTLVSGSWIGMEPGRQGPEQYAFEGLESPPLVTGDTEGRTYRLVTDELGALQRGSPVHFRQVRVGQVLDHELSRDGIRIDLFIEEEYRDRVRVGSRFWHASAFAVDLGAGGLEVESSAPLALFTGGIAFDNDPDAGPVAEAGHRFRLHGSRQESLVPDFDLRQQYRLEFAGSVAGLEPGAPVEFHGIRLGRVLEVAAEVDPDSGSLTLPVRIEVQPERLRTTTDTPPARVIPELVTHGLRARLTSASLIGGSLKVELAMTEDAEPASIDPDAEVPVLPTDGTPMRQLASGLAETVSGLAEIPFAGIGEDLAATARALREVTTSGDLARGVDALDDTLVAVRETVRETGPELDAAVTDARAAMEELRGLLETGSPERTELSRLLIELGEAARAVRELGDYLERHPEAILRGRDEAAGEKEP
jgi:paraquat-inducible protein B